MSDNSPYDFTTQVMVARGLIQAVMSRLYQSTTSADVNAVFVSIVDDALKKGLPELPNLTAGETATTLLELLTTWTEDSELEVWEVTRSTDCARRTRHVTYELFPLDQLAAETAFCPFSPYNGELADSSFFLFLMNGYLSFEESNPTMTVITLFQRMALRDGKLKLANV